MYRIDGATAVPALPTPEAVGPNVDGFFTNGDPGGGTPATIVPADWLNAVQEELAHFITQASITLSKTTRTQLKTALDYHTSVATKGFINGLGLSWVDNDTIQVAAGQAVDATGVKLMTKASTQNVTINTAAGINSIDAGSQASSTWYAVWQCNGATGTGYVLSTSFTAPTLPSGYNSYKRLIGAVYNNASGNLEKFYQSGNSNVREVVWDSYRTINSSVNPANNTWTATSTSGAFLPTAITTWLKLHIAASCTNSGGAGNGPIGVRPVGSSSSIGHFRVAIRSASSALNDSDSAQDYVKTDSNGDIETARLGTQTGAVWALYAMGFKLEV